MKAWLVVFPNKGERRVICDSKESVLALMKQDYAHVKEDKLSIKEMTDKEVLCYVVNKSLFTVEDFANSFLMVRHLDFATLDNVSKYLVIMETDEVIEEVSPGKWKVVS